MFRTSDETIERSTTAVIEAEAALAGCGGGGGGGRDEVRTEVVYTYVRRRRRRLGGGIGREEKMPRRRTHGKRNPTGSDRTASERESERGNRRPSPP